MGNITKAIKPKKRGKGTVKTIALVILGIVIGASYLFSYQACIESVGFIK